MSIIASLERRVDKRTVNRDIARHRQAAREIRTVQRAAVRRRYADGLPAELSSLRQAEEDLARAVQEERRAVRIAYLSRVGRRIALGDLLRERREDGSPVWCVVDPHRPIGGKKLNGKHDTDGLIYWPRLSGDRPWVRLYEREESVPRAFVPTGLPALPASVRALARDPAILRRAARIGVLFQPQEWREVQPDPALIVEWKDIPDVYFALAVWGHDGPRIMEFVD